MQPLPQEMRDQLLESGKQWDPLEVGRLVDKCYNEHLIATTDRFHNEFFYEICPLVEVARHLGADVTGIVFTGRRERFDGMILLDGRPEAQIVEVTAAIDGQNDALQMELIARDGHAPAFQRIEASGTKRNREFGKNIGSSYQVEDYMHKTLREFVYQAIQLKSNKAEGNAAYLGAWLLVVFDDWVCPVPERKIVEFDPFFRDICSELKCSRLPFDRLFFVGVSRTYIFDSEA